MIYQDTQYSNNFCTEITERCLQNIATNTSFNLVAMPGVGVTFFMRHLAGKSRDRFVFINSYEMHDFTRQEFFQQLARKLDVVDPNPDVATIAGALKDVVSSGQKIVLVLNRFDRLGSLVDQTMFDNFRYLRDVDRSKIVIIFMSARPLVEELDAGTKDVLGLVMATTYFPLYSSAELQEINSGTGNALLEAKALELAAGHHTLAQILHRCQNLDNALSDPMVELVVRDIFLSLDANRRRILELVATKSAPVDDPLLIHAGYVVQEEESRVFTPLLHEFIQRQNTQHLPVKEQRLFNLLKRHAGQLVTKADIFDAVWLEDDGIASEWSLNALVYRLRRHAGFDDQRYTIESVKKRGYILHDHTKNI